MAARLARSPDQKKRVRRQAIALLGASNAGYYCARALQTLALDDLVNDVPLLAVHHDWAARSLAAVTWAESSPDDPTIGLMLADDQDPRVRRALADTTRRYPATPALDTVSKKLANDPRFSVRALLNQD